MRFWLLMTLVIMVLLATVNAENKRKKKKKEGCLLNGKVYKPGTIAYRNRSSCVRVKCVLKTNKKGKTKFILKVKPLRNCRCVVSCPKCSNEWDPVCASNNKTYVNSCQLWGFSFPCGTVQAELLHKGECGKCPTTCPKDVKSVCGSDGQTYDNECQLLKAACDANTAITVAHKVKCEDAPAEPGPGSVCKFNGKKYKLGETIRYLELNCMAITCQPSSGTKNGRVTFEELQGSRPCDCTRKPKN